MQPTQSPSLLTLPKAGELYRPSPSAPYHFRRVTSVRMMESVSCMPEKSASEEDDLDLLTSELQALAQIQRESLKKPLYFNVIVVGDAGLGKSSFIDCVLRLKFHGGLLQNVMEEKAEGAVRPPTRAIKHHRASKMEGNLEVRIDLIDTPGYGTSSCFEDWLKSIIAFVSEEDLKFVAAKEQGKSLEDTRIHLCLYFVEGSRVKKSDLLAMLALQSWVSIIPILAKADAFTPLEIVQVKLEITRQLQEAGALAFRCETYMGSGLRLLTESPLGPSPPFAVISAVEALEQEIGKVAYGRIYPWGTCDISNSTHSDFTLLYHVLIGYLMQPAIDNTELLVRKQAKMRTTAAAKPNTSLLKLAPVLGIIALGSLLTYRLTR